MNKYLIVAIVLLAAICAWQHHNIAILTENTNHLSEQLVSRDKYISLIQKNTELITSIDEQRIRFEQFLNNYREENRDALEKLLQQDKQASDWSATRIPDSLLRFHKNSAAARSGITGSTRSSSTSNTISGTEREH